MKLVSAELIHETGELIHETGELILETVTGRSWSSMLD